MNAEVEGLDLVQLLQLLEPIEEPPLISLWPQTMGWIVIGVAAILIGTWLFRRALLRRRANFYRRAALEEIETATDSPAKLAEIVRRTALAAYPRADVAGLYGEDWLAFLDRTGRLSSGDEGQDFRQGSGRAFAQAPYVSGSALESVNAGELASLASRWVRGHRGHRIDAEGES